MVLLIKNPLIKCYTHVGILQFPSKSSQLQRCVLGRNIHLRIQNNHLLRTYQKCLKPFRFCHAKIEADDDNERKSFKETLNKGPNLDHFISNLGLTPNLSKRELKKISHPYVSPKEIDGQRRKVFFKVYGCQMNSNDADVAWAVLKQNNYTLADSLETADIILIVTCSIREGAETKIWRQLEFLRSIKKRKKTVKIGVLGCMAERIGSEIIKKESSVDIVAGPDSYKDLPRLLAIASEGEKTVNVLLSHDETYATINPVSLSKNEVSAYVSIMRGCDNMCSYCIVPFTRGRERSRNFESIIDEVKYLSDQGVKEITLLGQNVNSYRDVSEVNYASKIDSSTNGTKLSKGFKTIYKNKVGGRRFSDLLDKASLVNPEMRIRFTSPHPKDFPDELLYLIKDRSNICNNLHLPAQCGNTRILELMNRGYTRESYLELVWHIKSIIPSVALSSDFICGFCGETEEEFQETLSLMQKVQYNFCFIYPYSMREKTSAHRNLKDDVPHHVKLNRLKQMNSVFREIAHNINNSKVGQRQLILITGESKRSSLHLVGRNDGNINVVIPNMEIPDKNSNVRHTKPGDYVEVVITDASSQVLIGAPINLSSIKEFSQ
ncbi:UNVERIFIED_CONTAM: hypothetical protein RMT77_011668 [Armadillidium vulgare]